MAIAFNCEKCGDEIHEFSAILFGPPDEDLMARKHHLCRPCYEEVAAEFN